MFNITVRYISSTNKTYNVSKHSKINDVLSIHSGMKIFYNKRVLTNECMKCKKEFLWTDFISEDQTEVLLSASFSAGGPKVEHYIDANLVIFESFESFPNEYKVLNTTKLIEKSATVCNKCSLKPLNRAVVFSNLKIIFEDLFKSNGYNIDFHTFIANVYLNDILSNKIYHLGTNINDLLLQFDLKKSDRVVLKIDTTKIY